MTKNFYLDGMLDSAISYPGKVQISVPVWVPNGSDGYSAHEALYGVLTSEPTFTSRNKWGPILSDVSNLSDISAMLGDNEIFSWISASTQCWKGTEPLSFSLDFYLVNYKSGLNIEGKLRSLTKLTSLGKSSDRFDTVKVVAHGGYAADVLLKNNKDYFKNGEYKEGNQDRISRGRDYVLNPTASKGTASVKVGDSQWIDNLLVSRLDVTPSLAEVVDSRGLNPKPLYYKVSAGFTGVTPLIADSVDDMY